MHVSENPSDEHVVLDKLNVLSLLVRHCRNCSPSQDQPLCGSTPSRSGAFRPTAASGAIRPPTVDATMSRCRRRRDVTRCGTPSWSPGSRGRHRQLAQSTRATWLVCQIGASRFRARFTFIWIYQSAVPPFTFLISLRDSFCSVLPCQARNWRCSMPRLVLPLAPRRPEESGRRCHYLLRGIEHLQCSCLANP